jgi:hypothetical protein
MTAKWKHETVAGDVLTRVLAPAVTVPHALPAEPLDHSPNAAQ